MPLCAGADHAEPIRAASPCIVCCKLLQPCVTCCRADGGADDASDPELYARDDGYVRVTQHVRVFTTRQD